MSRLLVVPAWPSKTAGRAARALAMVPAVAVGGFAQSSTPPRLARALELARAERKQAQAERDAATIAQARTSASARVARARAWEEALQRAARTATPQDSDALITESRAASGLRRQGQPLPADAGRLLREGDVLTAGPGGLIEIRFHDGTEVALGPGSEAEMLEAPRLGASRVTFALKSGILHWETPAAPQEPARVLTPSASTMIHDGAYDVAVDAGGLTSVRPYRGRVETAGRPDAVLPGVRGWWERDAKLDGK